jgi:hypothetical protein
MKDESWTGDTASEAGDDETALARLEPDEECFAAAAL